MESLRTEMWKTLFLVVRDLFPLHNLSLYRSESCLFSAHSSFTLQKKKKSSRVQGYVSIQAYTHNADRSLRPVLTAFLALPPTYIKDQEGLGSRNGSRMKMVGGFWSKQWCGEPRGTLLPFRLPSWKTHAPDNIELHGVRQKCSQDENV